MSDMWDEQRALLAANLAQVKKWFEQDPKSVNKHVAACVLEIEIQQTKKHLQRLTKMQVDGWPESKKQGVVQEGEL